MSTSFAKYVAENPTGPITNLPNKLTIYLLDKNINEARQAGFDNEYTFVSHKDYTLSSNGNSAKISKSTITANKEGLTIFTFTNGDQKQTVEVEVLSIQATLTLPESISLSLNEEYDLASKEKNRYIPLFVRHIAIFVFGSGNWA